MVQLLVRIAYVCWSWACSWWWPCRTRGWELLPLIAGLGVAGAGIAHNGRTGSRATLAAVSVISPSLPGGEYIAIAAGEEGQVEAIHLSFNTTLSHLDLLPDRDSQPEDRGRDPAQPRHDPAVERWWWVATRHGSESGHHHPGTNCEQPIGVEGPGAPFPAGEHLADSSVNIAVKPWVQAADYAQAVGDVNKAVLESFRSRGIVIPGQREVRAGLIPPPLARTTAGMAEIRSSYWLVIPRSSPDIHSLGHPGPHPAASPQ